MSLSLYQQCVEWTTKKLHKMSQFGSKLTAENTVICSFVCYRSEQTKLVLGPVMNKENCLWSTKQSQKSWRTESSSIFGTLIRFVLISVSLDLSKFLKQNFLKIRCKMFITNLIVKYLVIVKTESIISISYHPLFSLPSP